MFLMSVKEGRDLYLVTVEETGTRRRSKLPEQCALQTGTMDSMINDKCQIHKNCLRGKRGGNNSDLHSCLLILMFKVMSLSRVSTCKVGEGTGDPYLRPKAQREHSKPSTKS